MTKRGTFELLKKIAVFYDQFVVDQEKVNLWHEMLKDYSLKETQANLHEFVRSSPFPPKIADLVQKSGGTKGIPTLEETKKLITAKYKPASEELIQRELSKMRAILGIGRG
ncbi:replicative helicase loader/inhibitor [Neobacillus sp. NPDC097160]|uniref:replicative helicase loader/inhibitor n=1 Tax=Neobacillus sp. NPDC097160 TaxID=3364298 RepID=UPI0037F5F3B2